MIASLWLVASLSGQRALVVPLIPCGPCGQDMPADHTCKTEAAPDAPGAAPDLTKEITHGTA